MACWPANVVGAFFVSVLIIDCIMGTYGNLLTHSIVGIIVTIVFFMICGTLGEDLSASLLVVPSVLILVFVLSLWFIGESLRNRGYCIKKDTCDPGLEPISVPVYKDTQDEDYISDETYYFFFPWLKPSIEEEKCI
jgi:hypothetical protein